MKIPLRFQVTEFDCGTVSLLNAFSYLFDREKIPAELVRAIHMYTLDCHDEQGNIGAGGTSREAVRKLSNWITKYANSHDFKVNCTALARDSITLEKFRECIKNKGCVFVRVMMGVEHYVIITDIDSKYAYIFDPYYLPKKYYSRNKNVKIVLSKPFSYNRKVNLKRLFSETTYDFSLGKVELRDCVLINKVK